MKATMSRLGVLAGVLLSILAVLPVSASFTSLYCFGDGVCTTTDNDETTVPELFHGHRFCNGRVWVEVFAQWEGLPYDPAKNQSYFGHNSVDLVANTAAFTAPADVATALVITWSANADLVGWVNDPGRLGYTAGDILAWTLEIDQSVLRHAQAVTNLYDKGVRTVIMGNAADVTETPAYIFIEPPSARPFIRERAIQFNAALRAAMQGLADTHPGLTIYQPDIFGFFDQVIADPAAFGLVNAPGEAGTLSLPPPYLPEFLYGPAADYVFWDYWHPSAKFQMHLAEFVRGMISPPRLAGISIAAGNTNLQVRNIPLGREGLVESSASPEGTWDEETTISEPTPGGSTGKVVPVPATGPVRFFRVRFPVVWTWP